MGKSGSCLQEVEKLMKFISRSIHIVPGKEGSGAKASAKPSGCGTVRELPCSTATEPHFPRAELTALGSPCRASMARLQSCANQKLTHLRVTGQKKSAKNQQVKGNLGPCMCLCPQIAPAELLGSCLPALSYLQSPPEALSVWKSHSIHTVGHI